MINFRAIRVPPPGARDWNTVANQQPFYAFLTNGRATAWGMQSTTDPPWSNFAQRAVQAGRGAGWTCVRASARLTLSVPSALGMESESRDGSDGDASPATSPPSVASPSRLASFQDDDEPDPDEELVALVPAGQRQTLQQRMRNQLSKLGAGTQGMHIRSIARIKYLRALHRRAIERRRAAIRVLASYVPGIVLRRSLTRRQRRFAPALNANYGVVLIADVSGFTKLAGYLASGLQKKSALDVSPEEWGKEDDILQAAGSATEEDRRRVLASLEQYPPQERLSASLCRRAAALWAP